MTKRILLAGILGGFALFGWGAVSHMVLGLGDAGMKYMPDQQLVMQAMKAALPQPGFYFFPRGDAAGNLPPDQIGGQYGILIYHPTGARGMTGRQLTNEFILNVVLALLAAFLLSLATGLTAYGRRVGFVVVVGLMATLMTHVQYWNWYGFPALYTVANIFENLVGFLIVGLIVATFVKPSSARVLTMPMAA